MSQCCIPALYSVHFKGALNSGEAQPIVVQQQVQLHGTFRSAELGPIKHLCAEIDHRGIQAHQRVLESELPFLSGSWVDWPPRSGTSPAVAQTPSAATAKADAH